eukprot:GHVP01061301.1.p1 GENE.GHVP01061301.1~~GHVP01061301.1.p1  ORF type:complete len:620 (+),score=87.40 GHVP01061301.1:1788-3647(+)
MPAEVTDINVLEILCIQRLKEEAVSRGAILEIADLFECPHIPPSDLNNAMDFLLNISHSNEGTIRSSIIYEKLHVNILRFLRTPEHKNSVLKILKGISFECSPIVEGDESIMTNEHLKELFEITKEIINQPDTDKESLYILMHWAFSEWHPLRYCDKIRLPLEDSLFSNHKAIVKGSLELISLFYKEEPPSNIIKRLKSLTLTSDTSINVLAAKALFDIYSQVSFPCTETISLTVMTTLKRAISILSKCPLDTQNKTIRILRGIIADSEYIRITAIQIGVIKTLSTFLTVLKKDPIYNWIWIDSLNCMSDLCLDSVSGRVKLFETGIPEMINCFLRSETSNLVLNACNLLFSISKSSLEYSEKIYNLNICKSLASLLKFQATDRTILICKIITNLSCESSPIRFELIEESFERLIYLSDCPSNEIAALALGCFKNFLYYGETNIKQRFIEEFTIKRLVRHIHSSSSLIQTFSLSILRNLTCSSGEVFECVVNEIRLDNLFELCKERIQLVSCFSIDPIYIISNISLYIKKKERIRLAKNVWLIESLFKLLDSDQNNIRIGALWLIGNLTWKGEPGTKAIITHFERVGVKDHIIALRSKEDSLEIQERIESTLENFSEKI